MICQHKTNEKMMNKGVADNKMTLAANARLSTGRSGPALAHFGWPWPWLASPGLGRPWPLLYLEINFIEYENAFYK